MSNRNFANIKVASLGALAYALRNPQMWPSTFGPWNYMKPPCCAMGLSEALWGVCGYELALREGIPRSLAHDIFLKYRRERRLVLGLIPWGERGVSPETVASEIEDFLRKKVAG